ncbi:MAG TPA: hypothetical protein VJB91_01920 [Patescibacteria group bacterium]|nr:hypothetical protein [Patescibacteria group bacterium]
MTEASIKRSPIGNLLATLPLTHSLQTWFEENTAPVYSGHGFKGKDRFSSSIREQMVRKITGMRLIGEHTLVPQVATLFDPLFFWEEKLEIEGLNAPAVTFLWRKPHKKHGEVLIRTAVAVDKIKVEWVDSLPSVSFTFDLSELIRWYQKIQLLQTNIVFNREQSAQVYTDLTGKLFINPQKALLDLVSQEKQTHTYLKDKFLHGVTFKLPKGLKKTEDILNRLTESL